MTALTAGYRPLLAASLRAHALGALPWLLAIPALPASSAAAYDWVLPDVQSRQRMALALRWNPAFKLIFGPPGEMLTRDGFAAWHSLTLGCFFTAVMATLLLIRASRADEDSGQAELIASGTMRRGTRLLVAETLVVLASAAVAVGTLISTVASGGGLTASALLAAAYAACGLVFGAVAAVAAQLGAAASTARAIAFGVLGASSMLRGWVDARGTCAWATWTTPIAWIQHTRPAVDNDWRPLLLSLVAAAAITMLAHALQGRRDFGLAVIAPRPGAARGGFVASLPGFIWRLNRNAVIAWLVALTVLGAEFGNVATSIGAVIAANPDLAQIIAAGATSEAEVTAGFVVVAVTLLGILAALPGVQVIARLGTEEDSHRLEPILAGGARCTTLATAVAVALLGSATGLLLGGAALALVATGQGGTLTARDVMWQAVACIPATWSLVALTAAAFGAARRLTPLGWMSAAAAFVLTILGPLFHLDERFLSLSPFWHVPNVTAPQSSWSATILVALIALLLLAPAFTAFRNRDVH